MMVNKIKIFFSTVLLALSFFASAALANNLEIENFEVATINQSANTITFSADISWENSWAAADSHDAVWVFVKYSTDGGATWKHASMSNSGTNPSGFSAPVNFSITVPSDEKGFFFKRSSFGSGNAQANGVLFVWDYNQDGLSDAQAVASNTINKVFGIEVAYVAEGAFYAGDGNSNSDYRFKQGSSDDDPWYIQSESAITTTNTASNGFYYTSTGASNENATGDAFLIPTSFPKGYNDFYQMKYELTERQWVNFFNTLTSAQKQARDITSSTEGGKNSDGVVNRNSIAWDSSNLLSNATTDRPDRPVSYLSWVDLLAYADWAGLRPMTELEFEKAARGKDISSVANEYAWGKTTYNSAEAGEIFPNSDEEGEEQIFDGNSNMNANALSWTSGDGRVGGAAASQKGPLRVGIFAETSTNRATSGAGYYGAMELSGNLHEMVVTVGRSQGRQFLGTHGDGTLTTLSGYEGNATNSDWPGISTTDAARGVTGTVGSGYRGGDFASSDMRYFQISTRLLAAKDADSAGYDQRYDASSGVYQGGRLVRTAP